MSTIKARLDHMTQDEVKKIALAVHLGTNCQDIEESGYDTFEVSPGQKKQGQPPAYFVKYAEDLKNGLREYFNFSTQKWEHLIDTLLTLDKLSEEALKDNQEAAYKHLYTKASKQWQERAAPAGSIHYWANGLYHLLCSDVDSEDWHVYALRTAFNNEIPEDRREYRHINSGEYMVLTNEEADERATEYVMQVWEECYLHELPKDNFLMKYIDLDKATKDAIEIDGRGHSLSGYDGEEHEVYLPNYDTGSTESNHWLFIYRTN